MIKNPALLNIINEGMLEAAPSRSDDCVCFKGFGFISDILKEDFEEVREWAEDGLRHVTVNKELLTIFTYCEGDLSLSVAPSKAAFKREIARVKECYEIAF